MTTRVILIETFPEFTKAPEGVVNAHLAVANRLVSASVFGDDHAFAVVSLACHFLSLESAARKHGAAGAVLRKLRQRSKGDESDTASVEFSSPSDEELTHSAYGRIYLRVQRSHVCSVMIGGV